MALNDAQFKADLKTLFDGTLAAADDAETAEANFINALAAAVKNYITSATINYTGGLTAGSTPVAGTFEGNLQ